MLQAVDARGRTIDLHHAPWRIVSLVPSQTELLAGLGLDEEVVGVTRFCVHPRDWKNRKQIVGGTKLVRLDRIEELKPDLILANLEENTREDVEALESIAPVFVTNVRNVTEAEEMIGTIGTLAGRAERAATLAGEIRQRFRELSPNRKLSAVYLIWSGPLMTVGADTFIHDVMSRGGFANLFGTSRRYPEVTLSQIAAAQPDVLLLPSEPYPFDERHIPEFADAMPETQIRLVDGQLFSWYGSRLLETPSYLARIRAELEVHAPGH